MRILVAHNIALLHMLVQGTVQTVKHLKAQPLYVVKPWYTRSISQPVICHHLFTAGPMSGKEMNASREIMVGCIWHFPEYWQHIKASFRGFQHHIRLKPYQLSKAVVSPHITRPQICKNLKKKWITIS